LKKFFIALFSWCILFVLQCEAQQILNISGIVIDEHDSSALTYAQIKIKEIKSIFIATDSFGKFKCQMPQGAYHFVLDYQHSGPQEIYVKLQVDTTLIFSIEKHVTVSLDEVVAQGNVSNGMQSKISEAEQRRNFGLQLAEIINAQAGVSTIKSSGSVSKPVVHGFSNNRLSVLINGQALGSQRWGFDHAPEIDAMQNCKISVLKGSQVLQVQDNTYGGAILVEQNTIKNEPHAHGAVTSAFQNNGRRIAVAAYTEQALKQWKYRIQASAKRGGDLRTPNYFLRNTGAQEINFSLFLQNQAEQKRWQKSIYYSFNSTKMGVLLGTQVSNLTDLQAALASTKPFGTQDKFSYNIDAPHQQVQHHFLQGKWLQQKNINTRKFVNLSAQINWRKEYDVRRGTYSDKPNLSVVLQTLQGEYGIEKQLRKTSINTALQAKIQNNVNVPGTGIIPIVPNYYSNELGAFARLAKGNASIEKEISARGDMQYFIAYPYYGSNYTSVQKVRGRYAFAASMKVHFSKWKASASTLFALRNPEMNELFSYGLHQGIAAIEEGSSLLKSERAFNNLLELKYRSSNNAFTFSVSPYVNLIDNYIFLQGTNELRLTTRGAFPVFAYKQTRALLHGLDVQSIYHVQPFTLENSISIIRAKDVSNNTWLPFIPSDRLDTKLSFALPKIKNTNNLACYIKHRYVARQTRFSPIQDYLFPPAAYQLWHAGVDGNFSLGQQNFNASIVAENLLNVQYREYMNRARYFADDEGRNFRVVLKYNF
jgi:iron complex outermembrane recepter protein